MLPISALYVRLRRQFHSLVNSRLGRALIARIIPEPIRTGKFVFHTGTVGRVEPMQRLQIKFGRYERLERELVSRFLCRDFNTIDLGASLGVISCEILQHLQSGRLLAVEADAELARIVRQNLSANFPEADAEVINAAVGAPGGDRRFCTRRSR